MEQIIIANNIVVAFCQRDNLSETEKKTYESALLLLIAAFNSSADQLNIQLNGDLYGTI